MKPRPGHLLAYTAVFVLTGCASAPVQPQAQSGLKLCMGPVVSQQGNQYDQGDFHSEDLARARFVPSLTAAQGCDLVIVIHDQNTGGFDWTILHLEAISGVSGQTLWSEDYKSYKSLVREIEGMINNVETAFAPGTPWRQRFDSERPQRARAATRPSEPASPPLSGERLAKLRAAEGLGDAALKAGKQKQAFQHYVEALSGPVSADADSNRVRVKLMTLESSYSNTPAIPEEARRHMVRAKAMIKDAQSPDDLQHAYEEMAATLLSAPWWADAYYNLGLVAEKRGYINAAIGCLKLYVLARPKAPDVRAVQDKIYALGAKLESRP